MAIGLDIAISGRNFRTCWPYLDEQRMN